MSGSQQYPYVVREQRSTASPVVTISGLMASDRPRRVKKKLVYKGLHLTGLIQIAIGLATVFLGLVHIVLHAYLYYIVCPIWSGLLFLIVPGIVGVTAACKRDRCTTTAYMVLEILGSMATVAIITLAAISAVLDRQHCSHSYNPDSLTCLSTYEARVAVGIFLCLLAFTDGVVAVVGAGMSCGALCCCTGHSTAQPTAVRYFTPGPLVTVPQPIALSNPGGGGPPQYEEAIHDPVIGAQAGAEANNAYDYGHPHPIKVKPADSGISV